MPKSIDYAREAAAHMLDEELISIFDRIKPGEKLTPLQQAVVDEIERRNLDS